MNLAKATRLGYLKVERPFGPIVDAYQELCQEQGRPMVLLYRERPHRAAISYRLCGFHHVLTQSALEQVRRLVEGAQVPRTRRHAVVCGNGGEITNLRPELAEVVAFWIADAALDSDQTQQDVP